MALLLRDSAHDVEKRKRPSPMQSFAAHQGPPSGRTSSRVLPAWPLMPPSGPRRASYCPSPPTSGVRGPTFPQICMEPRQAPLLRWYFPPPLKGQSHGLFLFFLFLAHCSFSLVLV